MRLLLLFHFAYELIPRWRIYARPENNLSRTIGTRDRRMNSTLVAADPPPPRPDFSGSARNLVKTLAIYRPAIDGSPLKIQFVGIRANSNRAIIVANNNLLHQTIFRLEDVFLR